MSLPVIPVHTISLRGVISAMIQAIQVGIVTLVVPPGSLIGTGTAAVSLLIIILILSGKWLILVNSEGVAPVPRTSNKVMTKYVVVQFYYWYNPVGLGLFCFVLYS